MPSRLLSRYWFPVAGHIGIGVTAYSLDEARYLAKQTADELHWGEPGLPIEDVDIRDLDQGHVIPNMGPPNLHGVWYPMLNL